jgi:2,5-furandicarboxylate decarboxylase 1
VTVTTYRHEAVFQALLTHILKQLPFDASFLKLMREQFPTLSKVAVPSSVASPSASSWR